MTAGGLSARELTAHCLARMVAHDGKVNAILELNPDALQIADALTVLQAMSGPNPADEITQASAVRAANDWPLALTLDALQGARIGVARNYCGFGDAVDDIFALCLEILRESGAVVDQLQPLPMTNPEATSRAANRDAAPWRISSWVCCSGMPGLTQPHGRNRL